MLSVSQLFIHPLKSARGLEVSQFRLNARGPELDRHWMVVNPNNKFLSQREHPRMCLIEVTLSQCGQLKLYAPLQDPCAVEESGNPIEVQIWKDAVTGQDAGDKAAEWLSAFLKTPCRLVSMPNKTQRQVDRNYASPGATVGFADGFPLLVISQASLDYLNEKLETPISMQRFRPNIVIKGALPHAEDEWREIRIGDTKLLLVKQCSRCVVPSIDPATATKQAEVISTLNQYRRQGREINFGMNALHQGTGAIHMGDNVEIIA